MDQPQDMRGSKKTRTAFQVAYQPNGQFCCLQKEYQQLPNLLAAAVIAQSHRHAPKVRYKYSVRYNRAGRSRENESTCRISARIVLLPKCCPFRHSFALFACAIAPRFTIGCGTCHNTHIYSIIYDFVLCNASSIAANLILNRTFVFADIQLVFGVLSVQLTKSMPPVGSHVARLRRDSDSVCVCVCLICPASPSPFFSFVGSVPDKDPAEDLIIISVWTLAGDDACRKLAFG